MPSTEDQKAQLDGLVVRLQALNASSDSIAARQQLIGQIDALIAENSRLAGSNGLLERSLADIMAQYNALRTVQAPASAVPATTSSTLESLSGGASAAAAGGQAIQPNQQGDGSASSSSSASTSSAASQVSNTADNAAPIALTTEQAASLLKDDLFLSADGFANADNQAALLQQQKDALEKVRATEGNVEFKELSRISQNGETIITWSHPDPNCQGKIIYKINDTTQAMEVEYTGEISSDVLVAKPPTTEHGAQIMIINKNGHIVKGDERNTLKAADNNLAKEKTSFIQRTQQNTGEAAARGR